MYSFPKMLIFMWNDDQPFFSVNLIALDTYVSHETSGGCGHPHAADHPCSVLYASEQRREHRIFEADFHRGGLSAMIMEICVDVFFAPSLANFLEIVHDIHREIRLISDIPSDFAMIFLATKKTPSNVPSPRRGSQAWAAPGLAVWPVFSNSAGSSAEEAKEEAKDWVSTYLIII